MYSAFKEFYNLLSQLNNAYHDAALKLGLTDSELDILSMNTVPAAIRVFFTKRPAPQNPRSTPRYAGWNRPVICT